MYRNGIKPTRLWYLTGRKQWKKMIDDKHAVVDHPLDQRDKKDMLQLVVLCIGSAIGLAYSYGGFNPKDCPTTIINPEKRAEECQLPCQSDNIQKLLEPCPDSEKSQK